MNIPASAKLGKDYRLKISDSKNADDVVYTGFFKVTPKIPLLVKAVAAVALLVVAVATGPSGHGQH